MLKLAGSSKVWDFFIVNAIANTKVNCLVCNMRWKTSSFVWHICDDKSLAL